MRNAVLYFLFFPFIGFLNALKNYRSTWAKPTVIAFVAFFGMSMVKSEAVDSSRYVDKLKVMYANNSSFETITAGFYHEENGQPDVYVGIITYVFSLFTDSGNILFLFYGLVFGFFYANNIWLLLKESVGRLDWKQYLLLATFSMVIGFWTVNGVRMWTAAHVFFYGGFLYLYHNNRKGLFIACTSILIHFSFVFPILLLFLYILFRLNYKVLYFLYVASFFIVELNVEFIRTTLESYLPEFILPKLDRYLSDEHIEVVNDVMSNANWYIVYYPKFISYFCVFFLSMMFFKIKASQTINKILGFSLLFLAFANVASLLPSGGRFLNVAYLFSMATCFIILTKVSPKIVPRTVKFLSPLLFVFCLVSIRASFDFFNLTTLTNPVVVLLTDINKPLIEFFK